MSPFMLYSQIAEEFSSETLNHSIILPLLAVIACREVWQDYLVRFMITPSDLRFFNTQILFVEMQFQNFSNKKDT